MKGDRSKLNWLTAAFIFLFVYVIAALIWLFMSLDIQNELLLKTRLENMQNHVGDTAKTLEHEAYDFHRRKQVQYLGEGLVFFGIIITGAFFVWRATRRELKLIRQQQNFMMAVTHELKTPIAANRLNLETLQKRKLTEAHQQLLIKNSLRENLRLDQLSNNILWASRFESGKLKSSRSRIELSKLLLEELQKFKARHPAFSLEVQVEEELTLYGDEMLIEMMVNNLLENAAKYGDNQPAIFQADIKHNWIRIRLTDHGPGIPANEKKNIFKKFYRIGNEETRLKSGSGLGLFLVKKIAESHHGIVTVSDNQPSGAIFTVQLPGEKTANT